VTKIGFCTTCKGRLAHLTETLPPNLEEVGRVPSGVVVLLDYNSRDDLAVWVRENMARHLESGRLVYYRFTEPTPFRMAHAKNLSHRLAMREGCDTLVNMDADNFAGEGFAEYVLSEMAGGDNFLWARMIKTGNGRLAKGVSGRIVVTAHQFLLAGGYDERYHTWSPDDKDFCDRLAKLGFRPQECDPRYLKAILHNDHVRFREYQHVSEEALAEDFEAVGRWGGRVVNGGKIGLGVVYRNFDPVPVVVNRVPTRVFGIGLHKTGTTSLAKALTQLGYRCAHWPSAHWAKAVWEEFQADQRSLTLEKTPAATDLPLALLFRELDDAYPGSKFVLTTRDEGDWLRSVERHFSPDNRFWGTWKTDPFSHRLHTLLYGRKKFDKEVFLARYRQHTIEVREHFRRRSADLLEFNLSGGAGWHELCGFLWAEIPDVPYPRENRSDAAPAEVLA
jgi:hypothetical protein